MGTNNNNSGQVDAIVRLFGDMDNRVETGPIRFGNDFPGVFIRGDNALYYAQAIKTLCLENKKDPMALSALGRLWKILESCKEA